MINSSIFTCLPPFPSTPNHSFFGFSRYGKQDQITQDSWEKIESTVKEKVFDAVRKEFNMCTCCTDSIIFAWDKREVGVGLKKLQNQLKPLFEISTEHLDKKQLTSKSDHVKKVIKNMIDLSIPHLYEKGIENSSSIDPEELHQMEINEFAVRTLCEMSIEAGIEKKHIFEQIQQAKKDGYLSSTGYHNLQLTIFAS